MKKKIFLKRLFHRDMWRILISFKYDEGLSGIIRQINGIRYSDTYKCWYADDNEETLKRILQVFRETADVDISELVQNREKSASKTPEEKREISHPVLHAGLTAIESETDDDEAEIIKSAPTQVLKSARREAGDEIRSRNLGEKALDGLELMRRYLDEVRYSNRTNESYLAVLELFFKYFHEKDPLTISMDEVSEFVYNFIVTNGYSSSYQNQIVSAIKTFYRISGRSNHDFQLIERPRRSRALPKVFSKEEVQRILNATRNTKHKLLLWIIYSCGLRRSEVTNIRITDLDRDRSIVHIREGKGRVDRIVPVSKKVWEKLDEYIDGFHPGKYLFEGQSGERYSVESVYRVFKQALHRAGIMKDVGVHSLRHSYATHLHESGLDIRYIQELLGHRSTRTTEIYTHVSRRNLVQVRSPIEDMDVK